MAGLFPSAKGFAHGGDTEAVAASLIHGNRKNKRGLWKPKTSSASKLFYINFNLLSPSNPFSKAANM